jgi:hypothetical protein
MHDGNGGTVALDRGIDADTHRQGAVGDERSNGGIDTGIPPIEVDEGSLAGDKAVLDHANEGIGTEASSHLRQPTFILPRGDRLVAPEHQQAITGVEVVPDHRLL